jgi:hypothetical protein
MSLRRQLAPAALGCLLGTLSACGSDPSFEVNWRIAPSFDELGQASEPDSIAECTSWGLGGVRVTTIREGVTVDSRDFDCFADGAVAGPELTAGNYVIEVAGLRRNGTEWACVVPSDTLSNSECDGDIGCECTNDLDCDEGLSCAIIEGSNEFGDGDGDSDAEAPFIRVCDPCSARHVQELEVVAEQTASLEATLIAPPECDDGIDNDLDGLTDVLDPACAKDRNATEDADRSDTVINLTTTFLNDNPNANCDIEAPDAFPLDVVAFEAVVSQGEEVVDTRVLTCQRSLSIYSLTLPGGDYSLALTGFGVSPSVDPEATPVTITKTVDFTVSDQNGGFVGEIFDFSGEDFIPQLNGNIRFSSLFEIGGGVENTGVSRGCLSGGNNDSSPLNIDTVALRVVDADDTTVDPSALGLMGTEEDGAIVIDCPSSGAQLVETASLEWGAYRVEIEGRVGDVACFSETLQPLPGVQLTEPIDRVFVDGLPPAGCEDCTTDADCPSFFGICSDGICVSNP